MLAKKTALKHCSFAAKLKQKSSFPVIAWG